MTVRKSVGLAATGVLAVTAMAVGIFAGISQGERPMVRPAVSAGVARAISTLDRAHPALSTAESRHYEAALERTARGSAQAASRQVHRGQEFVIGSTPGGAQIAAMTSSGM